MNLQPRGSKEKCFFCRNRSDFCVFRDGHFTYYCSNCLSELSGEDQSIFSQIMYIRGGSVWLRADRSLDFTIHLLFFFSVSALTLFSYLLGADKWLIYTGGILAIISLLLFLLRSYVNRRLF